MIWYAVSYPVLPGHKAGSRDSAAPRAVLAAAGVTVSGESWLLPVAGGR